MSDFQRRIDSLDVSLFDRIETQSSTEDRQSWLALQKTVREREAGYSYLEVGSHLGGSIQQHLVDPKCRAIYSIDTRPELQPDDRGGLYAYPENSTKRMMQNLRSVASECVEKVRIYDGGTRDLDPSIIAEKVDLCFIDGEHTKAGVLGDWQFCRRVVAADGIIAFHDASIVCPAIGEILPQLRDAKIVHVAIKVGGDTFAILFGNEAANRAASQPIRTDGLQWLRAQPAARMRRKAADYARRTLPSWLYTALKRAQAGR